MRRIILALVMALSLPVVAHGATYNVCPDGSGDFLTLQAAITASVDGAVIELCDEIFFGDGNRDIDYLGKAITVRSQSGNAAACVIDCGGSPHRGLHFHSGEGSGSVLEDVTIMNAFSPDMGGGMLCDASSPTICMVSSPTLTNCTFVDNRVNAGGGGLFCGDNSSPTLTGCTFEGNLVTAPNGYGAGLFCFHLSSPTLEDCTFRDNVGGAFGGGAAFDYHCDPQLIDCSFMDNTADGGGGVYFITNCVPLLDGCTFADNRATQYGGAIWCGTSWPDIINCTLAGNGAGTDGGGIHLNQSSPTIDQTIIAFSTSGAAVYCNGAGNVPVLACCDVYGNAGGDWVGCIAAQAGTSGNISLDPEFRDAAAQDYRLEATSPCAPFSPPNTQCDLIGAWPVSSSDVAEEWAIGSAPVIRISPNPCSAATRIRFELPADVGVETIGIYDAAGRLVCELAEVQNQKCSWDARDSAGAPVEAGMYFVRLIAGGRAASERILLVR